MIGSFVTVDGHNMSVYVAGEGKHTLVFLAGGSLSEGYTDKEKEAGIALSCSRYCNETFENESKCIIEDRDKIESIAVPDVPTLLIVSNGKVYTGPVLILTLRRVVGV